MTETVPERIHVRWGKSGDVRVTYMEERFWPPDAEADYVPATALEAAQAREADLAAEVVRLRNALEKIRDRSDQMIWGEDHEIAAAMRDMEECARAALEGRT